MASICPGQYMDWIEWILSTGAFQGTRELGRNHLVRTSISGTSTHRMTVHQTTEHTDVFSMQWLSGIQTLDEICL